MDRQETVTDSLPPVLDAQMSTALHAIPTPLLSDHLDRLNGVVGLCRFNRRSSLVGTAFTVKTRPGDNLFVYKALELVRPGHVLVVDAGGDVNNAIVGEIIQLLAQSRGCVGFLIDGAIRDVATFEDADFPCYARAVSHRGPYKSGPGRLNVPVSIGGQVVNPGDVLVGDRDGVVVLAPSEVPRLIREAREKGEQEVLIKAEIASGDREQSWLSDILSTPSKGGKQ